MTRLTEKGKSLLVSGPASVTLLKGKASVLGAALPTGSRVIVRMGRALPFETSRDCLFDVVLGEGAKVEEFVGSTIPESWRAAVKRVLSLPNPCTAMVLGDVDCGKTTLCTFLANNSLSKGSKTAIVDADVGQSDIGPPTTVGLSLITEPVTDPFSLEAITLYFVGHTSPSGITDRVIHGITAMKQRVDELGADFTVINTDGWVQGEAAGSYKVAVVNEISPAVVIAVQQGEELEHILTAVEKEGFETLRLTSSPAAQKRDREERRRLREQGYRKFLRGAALRLLPVSWLRLEYTFLDLEEKNHIQRREELEKILGSRIKHYEEHLSGLLVVLRRGNHVNEEDAEKSLHKKVYVIHEGEEHGLLVGLLDRNREFLGLGTIRDIDYEKRVLRLYTPYRGKISVIQFGQVKVTRHGRELGVTAAFST